MISAAQFEKEIELIIVNAIREDVGDGDHSSLACIPVEAKGKAKLLEIIYYNLTFNQSKTK